MLRYDTRGAGLSEKISGVVTWNDMADDLKALLDALGIAGKVAIAGIAVGAAIGVHFAVRDPDRAAALVLHGPAPGVSADRRQQTLERAAAVEAGGMRRRRGNQPRELLPARCAPQRRRVSNHFRARWLANDPQSFAAINRMLAAEDISRGTDENRLSHSGHRRPARWPAPARR